MRVMRLLKEYHFLSATRGFQLKKDLKTVSKRMEFVRQKVTEARCEKRCILDTIKGLEAQRDRLNTELQ